MWILLNSLSVGQLLLGSVIALFASLGMASLQPDKPRLCVCRAVPRLILTVFYDILRSNIAVATIILQGRRRKRVSGFITIPLELRDRTGLAILAVIVTATPGTAWVEYNADRGLLLHHVFDLVDEAEWIDLVKNRYEKLLLEIFA
jgi:multicomponent K+:H+ antiporter subunit E